MGQPQLFYISMGYEETNSMKSVRECHECYFEPSRIETASMIVCTISGGLENTRSSEISALSRASNA